MATVTRTTLEKPANTAVSSAPFKATEGASESSQYLKLLIYAEFGAGKTVLLSQAVDVPELRDVVFINIEGGTKSIVGSGAVKNHKDLSVIPCRDFETFAAIHKMLWAYCQARDDEDVPRLERMCEKYGLNPKRRFKTVIIDSLSEMNQISLSRAFGEDRDDLLANVVASNEDSRGSFGKNRETMLRAIRQFRDLPMNVFVSCARLGPEMSETVKRPNSQPMLTGKLAKECQAFWDVVGYLETYNKRPMDAGDDVPSGETLYRRLWLQPVGKFDAKNRLKGQDITHIEDPTMKKLYSLLT
jgi:AAA domain